MVCGFEVGVLDGVLGMAFMLRGFRVCGVGLSGFFFGQGSLYELKRITLGIKNGAVLP